MVLGRVELARLGQRDAIGRADECSVIQDRDRSVEALHVTAFERLIVSRVEVDQRSDHSRSYKRVGRFIPGTQLDSVAGTLVGEVLNYMDEINDIVQKR